MHWTKRTVKTTVWEATENDFRIIEDADGEERPFRLEAPDADPEWFISLEQAKAVAELQNKVKLFEEENARLRAALESRGGLFPTEADDAVLNSGITVDEPSWPDEGEADPEGGDYESWVAQECDRIDPLPA